MVFASGRDMLHELFRLCDKDGNGNVDFNEFLKVIVGNVVSF